jgi:ubiquinone/menaquinone biosynthesis C-methylase UbiE
MTKQTTTKDIAKRFISKGVYPYQLAFILLIPLRNIFVSPKKLIKRLELRDNLNVLEVGPGPGYFSVKIARMLSVGHLVLADLQQEMLNIAKKRLQKRGLNNVEYYLCNGQTFEFTDKSFDRIFMVTVIGEVENKEAYIKEFERILKPGGIISITEIMGDSDKMSIEDVKLLMQNSHLEFYKLYGTQKNYTINFIKK